MAEGNLPAIAFNHFGGGENLQARELLAAALRKDRRAVILCRRVMCDDALLSAPLIRPLASASVFPARVRLRLD